MRRRTPADIEALSGNASKVGKPLTEKALGVLVDHTFTSWNQIARWLHQMEHFLIASEAT